MKKLDYRPDVDGLRALAVLAVLFYHARLKAFSGGFIGVDVFFVISGYLITTKILNGIQANSFSLVSFYEMRIRRIVPALFSVVLFTLIVGGWLYSAVDYEELGKSAIATTFSLANYLFWSQAGYFERPSVLKPLLHTWSLSIEEQFYLFLPILLVVISRYLKSKFSSALLILAGISFIASVYVLYQDASAAFYFAHLRAWEFLIGGLLLHNTTRLKTWHKEVLSFMGLAMILVAVFSYSAETSFPGQMALLPVSGAALIIYCGKQYQPFVSKILNLKPLVFIGKISYSLYLWHWPLIVFLRYYLIREATAFDILLWFIVTFILSYFSWKFIETPFRVRTNLVRPKIFIFAASFLILNVIFSSAVYFYQGFPSRFENDRQALSPVSDWDYEANQWIKCFAREENNYHFPRIDDTCLLGDGKREPSFFLWGDSHADAMSASLNASALRTGVTGRVIGGSGCPPLLQINFSVGPTMEYCFRQNERIVNYIEQHPEYKTIVLSSRWALYTNGTRYKTEEGSVPTLSDIEAGSNEPPSNAYLFEVGLERTVEKLVSLNREVVIVYPVPEIGYDVPSSYSIAMRTGRDINDIIAPTLVEFLDRNAIVLNVFEEIKSRHKDLVILEPSTVLCSNDKCKVIENHTPLYRDDDHLSTFGAIYVSSIFDPVLTSLLK
jgi:peptidoglycan/LPS O-acetylase OafA/YrhL